jgi:putative ABC transport system permease protein
MTTFINDLRYALRVMVRQPAFTVVAALTLAIGIGANTAIFSIVNAVLLRPLPFANPDSLVVLWSNTRPERGGATSPDDFLDFRREQHSFTDIAALANSSATLTSRGADAERLRGMRVSAGLLKIMGIPPQIGRDFLAGEDTPGGQRVVILSHGLWERRFAADPSLVGKALNLDGEAHTVVGIMPAGFDFPAGFASIQPPDFWQPLRLDPAQPNRGAHYLRIVGRLKPGVTMAAAQAEMTAIARKLEQQHPLTNTNWGVWLFPLHEEYAGDVRQPLLVLLVAVGCVLLIACANVANLLLARSTARSKELSVRAALGASRGRLIAQLLTESVLLAGIGGLLGLGIATWSLELVPALAGESLPRATTIGVDVRALVFTACAVVLTGFLFGLAPAWQVARSAIADSLRASSRSTGTAPGTHRLRASLVVGEVALAFVLLIGAGLMIRSYQQLESVRPGFSPERIVSAQLALPNVQYQEESRRTDLVGRYLVQLRGVPGVQTAAVATLLPMSRQEALLVFSVEGRPDDGPGRWPISRVSTVSDQYFETLAIPLVRGRYLDARDQPGTPGAAVISRTLARRFFKDQDPLGQRIKLAPPQDESPWLTIVGIVDDVRHRNLALPVEPLLYTAYAHGPTANMNVVVRGDLAPAELGSTLTRELSGLDRNLALVNVRTMEAVVSMSLASERFRTHLLGAFAAIALLLAAIGVYGVMAYSVEQRSQEMGLRMALGAEPRHVIRLVAGQGLAMIGAGLLIGVGGALALTRLLASLLYGVSPTDPLTFAAIAAILLAAAALATYIPARRATRADPMVVLRTD